uniref:Uncharacterized protein n=1 Tax=Avena sativa TaxID=4498 RepID=A0ACD5YNF6_AVESA
MDCYISTTKDDLERMLYDDTAEPKALPLSLLAEITNGFSAEHQIGQGGFAVVYQGILKNGKVAVKRLHNKLMGDKEFLREVECLMTVKHKNIVRFLGYCADTQGSMELYNGKLVMADVMQRLLCFEYVSKGSLDQYITDASCGLEWRNRYKIIKGICLGLHYLHQKFILHLDLKPANILLDDNWVPKIADFGLSRFFLEKQSRAITANIGGTLGYLPPEFCNGEITYLFDRFSLGVIFMELLTGKKGYHDVDNVVESWSNRLEASQGDIQLEQVRVCAEIGIECTDSNPAKRPDSTQHIIDRLDETGSTDDYIEAGMVTSQQEENSSSELHQDTPNDPGETSSQSQNFSFSWPTNLFLNQTPPAQMSEVVLPALTKIGFMLGDESTMVIIANFSKKATNLKKLPGQVEQIGKQLAMMGIAIGKISIVHLADGIIKSWIGEVRKLACRVEDVMDKWSYHVSKLNLMKFSMKRTRYDKVFTEIMDEVAKLEKEIQLVIQLRDQWLQPCEDSFRVVLQDEGFVGIKDNRMLLTRWLYSKEPDSTVITVSGMGGLGKSTLVSNVYEREKISFPVHAWIVVSQVYNIDDLLRKLLWKIGYTKQTLSADIDKMDVYDLKKKIQERLENRKYLIILDDLWEQEVYFQMQDALENLQGSRVIITTRRDVVAGISSPARHLELQPLSKPASFDLFCRRAFYNHKGCMCPKNVKMIATAIVDRCRGMPLAIVTIGSMLSFRQQLDIWQQTYDQLLELSTDNHVRDIINLCYHDLSGDLRNCLVYCSLFPGDYPMSCDSLVRLWVAEGFVLSKGNNTPEVVAEGMFMELIHRNMFEVVDTDELGRVNACKMHDIVRELAFSFAEEERYASANDYGTMTQIDRDVRRLSLCGWKDNSVPEHKFPRLRTLVSLGVISSSPDMLSSILSGSNYLTVLELQDSEITEVSASIGSLFNLRYIGLRRTKVKSLPDSVENLSNLQTLDIKQTKIEKLPRGIVKIRKLRHLLADRYADWKQTEFRYFIGMQAPKDLSNLVELQTLETVESSSDLAEQLKKLMQLRSLWIDNISAAECANLFATLSSMPRLSSLLLSATDGDEALWFEALKPKSTDLHRLIIRGQWAEGTLNCPIFQGHGTSLKYLALSWCHLWEDPLGKIALYIPNLTYLKLNNVRGGGANTLVLSADSFPNLTTLVLKHMHDVSELIIIDGALPSIEGLYIVSLSKLDKIPQGIESLRSLKKLWLLDLHKDFKTQWVTNGMHQKTLHVPEVRV